MILRMGTYGAVQESFSALFVRFFVYFHLYFCFFGTSRSIFYVWILSEGKQQAESGYFPGDVPC